MTSATIIRLPAFANVDTPTSDHHLFWPRDRYETSLERKFRTLGDCVISRKVDTLVHRAYHAHGEPNVIPPERLMNEQVERHHDRDCRCHSKREVPVVRFNLLQLPEDHELFNLSCLWSDVSSDTVKLLQEHFGPVDELRDQWAYAIKLRHQEGECSCAHFAQLAERQPLAKVSNL